MGERPRSNIRAIRKAKSARQARSKVTYRAAHFPCILSGVPLTWAWPGSGGIGMVYRRQSLIAIVCALGGFLAAQQKREAPEQSPRQAILEMFSGGEEAFKKHLTPEVQETIKELRMSSAPESADPVQARTMS